MKIILVGGGTGGPVIPLLAVAEEIKKLQPRAEFLFVGTAHGPERELAERAGFRFVPIPAGKLRRYFSLANIFTPFAVLAGFAKSLKILKRFRPDAVVGVGGFVQVPLAWAAWVLRAPVVLHQQDVRPSLANRLCQMAAKRITVAFESSVKDFPTSWGFFQNHQMQKVVWTGNPFREELQNFTKEQGLQKFHLRADMPVLYVTGGGTGSEFFNTLIKNALPELSKIVQIIHSTGKHKNLEIKGENYQSYEFINNPGYAFAAADIVLSRAGLSTITELANLQKVGIIIPIPDSHQEVNAEYLYSKRAAIILDQNYTKPEHLVVVIRKLLFNPDLQKKLSANIKKLMPSRAAKKIAEIVIKAADKK